MKFHIAALKMRSVNSKKTCLRAEGFCLYTITVLRDSHKISSETKQKMLSLAA